MDKTTRYLKAIDRAWWLNWSYHNNKISPEELDSYIDAMKADEVREVLKTILVHAPLQER